MHPVLTSGLPHAGLPIDDTLIQRHNHKSVTITALPYHPQEKTDQRRQHIAMVKSKATHKSVDCHLWNAICKIQHKNARGARDGGQQENLKQPR
jgi:hypothetical protein